MVLNITFSFLLLLKKNNNNKQYQISSWKEKKRKKKRYIFQPRKISLQLKTRRKCIRWKWKVGVRQ